MLKKKNEKGAITIEFAILFSVFFVILYAIIAYSIPFMLTLSLRHTAAEAAHAAIKVDPYLDKKTYLEKVSQQVTGTVNGTLEGSKTWLPSSWRSGDCDRPEANLGWIKIPSSPSFGWVSYNELNNINTPRHQIYICLQRKYNKNGATGETAIIPYLNLLGFEVPSLPKNSNGDTVLKGEAYTTHL